MANTEVQGCVFCAIIHNQPSKHLKISENTIIIRDVSPHAPHHYLILSKRHINKPNDLTHADLPLVREMDHVGREYLREILRQKGEADTVEDLLRMGLRRSRMTSVDHLHMHLLYPTSEMKLIYRTLVFRPGLIFHLTKDVIENLEREKNADGKTDLEKQLQGNPAITDPLSDMPEQKLSTAAATMS